MNYRIRKQVFFYAFVFTGMLLMLTTGCKKEKTTPVVPETGTVTDREGNVYKTVKIGSQWWMAENLKSRIFRNGAYVKLTDLQHNDEWQDTTSSYCIIDNSTTGFLYNNYTVTDTGNLAPAGWHIPSDDEWKELEKTIGMSQSEADQSGWRGTHEADKLKIESSLNGWTSYGAIWSTNESGFTALAGGCRLFNGTPGEPGLFATGFWWSSTSHSANEAWYRHLDYKKTNVFRSHCDRRYGYSVRCVKDN